MHLISACQALISLIKPSDIVLGPHIIVTYESPLHHTHKDYFDKLPNAQLASMLHRIEYDNYFTLVMLGYTEKMVFRGSGPIGSF